MKVAAITLLLATAVAGCTLKTYTGSHVKGYNGLKIRYEPGFESTLDNINNFARMCQVTVWVLHAYRKKGQDLEDFLDDFLPSPTSNHLVGHAIDIVVDTPNGWCNDDCLYHGLNSYGECLLQKILDSRLRWGGLWRVPEPFHVDDDLRESDRSEWQSLYRQLQETCE